MWFLLNRHSTLIIRAIKFPGKSFLKNGNIVVNSRFPGIHHDYTTYRLNKSRSLRG